MLKFIFFLFSFSLTPNLKRKKENKTKQNTNFCDTKHVTYKIAR